MAAQSSPRQNDPSPKRTLLFTLIVGLVVAFRKKFATALFQSMWSPPRRTDNQGHPRHRWAPAAAGIIPDFLLYKFEATLAWRPVMQGLFLLLIFIGLVFFGGWLYHKLTDFPVGKAYWRAWCSLSGGEPDFSEDPPRAKALVIIMTVMQICFFAFVVGIVESGFQAKLEELRGGRTPIFEKNHYVILGWNDKVPTIVDQLIMAEDGTGQGKARIAVLADHDKKEMDKELRSGSKAEIRYRTSKGYIVTRQGDPTNSDDQRIVAINKAKRVIILSSFADDIPADVADVLSVKSVLALKATKSTADVIVETRSVDDNKTIETIDNTVKRVDWLNMAARQLVQAARQKKGLIKAFDELSSFAGSEFYIRKIPQLTGFSVLDSQFMIDGGIICGIIKPGSRVEMNPPANYVFQKEDEIIILSLTQKHISIKQNTVAVDTSSFQPLKESKGRAERLLLLGWRNGTAAYLKEIDHLVGPGSTVTIVSDEPITNRREYLENENASKFRNFKIDHVYGDPGNVALLKDQIKIESYDNVMVLLEKADEVSADITRAEAKTLEILVAVKGALKGVEVQPTVVAEVAHSNTKTLVKEANSDADVLVLSEFSANLLAQSAFDPHALAVLTQMYSSSGADMLIKNPFPYIASGESKTFSDLRTYAYRLGETLVGYIKKNGDVIFHPKNCSVLNERDIESFICLGFSYEANN